MQIVTSGFFAGALINTLFRAAFADVQVRFVAAGEKSGRFQNDIHPEVLPRQLSRIALFQDFNLMATHDDILVIVANLAVELSMDRVPFQKMRERVRIGEIVDRADAFDILLRHGA